MSSNSITMIRALVPKFFKFRQKHKPFENLQEALWFDIEQIAHAHLFFVRSKPMKPTVYARHMKLARGLWIDTVCNFFVSHIRDGLPIENRILWLEKFVRHPAGTSLDRTLHHEEGMLWTLAMGQMLMPKKFFVAPTIEETVCMAEEFFAECPMYFHL